jgi:uncharacterized UPF0160 family protein
VADVSLTVGTHSGTFHADDVLACALIRTFVDGDAQVVRTRDRERLDACDIVVDVGGVFEPSRLRFDHHQSAYVGPRSSAGMVLDWLEASERIDTGLADHMRDRVVDYVDAVDTGREAPRLDVPCFARIVEAMGVGRAQPDEQLAAFMRAVEVGRDLINGLCRAHEAMVEARSAVVAAMEQAVCDGRAVMFLDQYYSWKPVYFEHGGAEHPTNFVVFPSDDGTWKLVAIPPKLGCFDQKRSLPESWAGRLGPDLEAATGVPGSVFCHKNRFIAVFTSRDALEQAVQKFDLDSVSEQSRA